MQATPRLLTDDDVTHHLTPTEAVAVMESVFVARAKGQVAGSPRWAQSFEEGDIVFTVGAVPEGVGFRTYLAGSFQDSDQLVAVWDRTSGRLQGVIVGNVLGGLRTGAIGGVAVKHMARPDSAVMALIGCGRQAYFQLRAIATTRHLHEVRVYCRTPENRQAFCEDMAHIIPNLNIFPVESPEEAIKNAGLVIGATSSSEPVIRGEWLSPGAHVTTVGPKGAARREVDEEVVKKAALIASDSPEQARNYRHGLILDGTDQPLHDLADVISGEVTRPSAEAVTLFVSTGLAGTEVALAARLIRKMS